jgi:nucleoside-diphosphate-sugar epimerase
VKHVLVTGATGVLGTEVLAIGSGVPGWRFVGASTRGANANGIVAWDMRRPPPHELRREWDVVVHAAASTRWSMSTGEAWDANVRTTEGLRHVVGPGTHLVHISTAYSTGRPASAVCEGTARYRNTYEWSKALTENLARQLSETSTIVRPPLIIGRRSDGAVARYSGLFTLLRSVLSGLAPALVGDHAGFLEIVPVDDVATCVVEQCVVPPSSATTIVLGAGSAALTVERVLDLTFDTLNAWRSTRGAGAVDRVPVISSERWERFYRPFLDDCLPPIYRRAVDALEEFHVYMSIRDPLPVTHRVFDVSEALRRSVLFWADRHPTLAARNPRPWSERRAASAEIA